MEDNINNLIEIIKGYWYQYDNIIISIIILYFTYKFFFADATKEQVKNKRTENIYDLVDDLSEQFETLKRTNESTKNKVEINQPVIQTLQDENKQLKEQIKELKELINEQVINFNKKLMGKSKELIDDKQLVKYLNSIVGPKIKDIIEDNLNTGEVNNHAINELKSDVKNIKNMLSDLIQYDDGSDTSFKSHKSKRNTSNNKNYSEQVQMPPEPSKKPKRNNPSPMRFR
jgi:cell division protein FtsB